LLGVSPSFTVCDSNYIVITGKTLNVPRSLDFHHYTRNIVKPNIVKSGFCSIQFTVTFAGTQNVDHYIGNIAISTNVKSGFHCNVSINSLKVAQRKGESCFADRYQGQCAINNSNQKFQPKKQEQKFQVKFQFKILLVWDISGT